ncbi:MAG: TIM barrel protein [Anaerolineae bacterium]|nr:TIM barrel protein [Thermoflexales bacterium]MDW8406790.1 TIM barrel protein [Anaerolineae bacterium]
MSKAARSKATQTPVAASAVDLPIRFGTVGSPTVTPKSGGSPAAIACIRELNLSALELAWVQSVSAGDELCARIRAAAEAHDVALSVHAPYYINLNAESEEMWQAGRDRLLAAARAGYKAGATDIVFHPGSYMKRDPQTANTIALSRLSEVADTLRKEKVAVTLRPETMGKRAMLGTLEETIEWSRQIESVLPCIDFAHLHARAGDGTFNSYDEFVTAIRLVAAGLGERGIKQMHIHFSGIAYTDKGEKHHLNLADSDIKFKEFFQALADLGVSGRVLCETPNLEEDAVLMQNTYRRAYARAAR